MDRVGPPLLPARYNSNLQIVQGPGYVAIETEEIHDVRIIPVDGRPHLAKNIHQWMGDSVGRWEGNTQVWRNRQAYDAHLTQEHSKRFREKIQPGLGSPFDERLYNLVQ